jgi:hypothetical protein
MKLNKVSEFKFTSCLLQACSIRHSAPQRTTSQHQIISTYLQIDQQHQINSIMAILLSTQKPGADSLLTRTINTTKIIHIQFTVTFPTYAMHPIEQTLIYILIPLSTILFLGTALWISKFIFFAVLSLLEDVGAAQGA